MALAGPNVRSLCANAYMYSYRRQRITALRARGGDRGTALSLPGMHTGDAVGVDLVPGIDLDLHVASTIEG